MKSTCGKKNVKNPPENFRDRARVDTLISRFVFALHLKWKHSQKEAVGFVEARKVTSSIREVLECF